MEGFQTPLTSLQKNFDQNKQIYLDRIGKLESTKTMKFNLDHVIAKHISIIKSTQNMKTKFDHTIQKVGDQIDQIMKHKKKTLKSFDDSKKTFEENISGLILEMQKFKYQLENDKQKELSFLKFQKERQTIIFRKIEEVIELMNSK